MGRRPHTSHSMFALAPKMAATGGTQGTMGGMEEEAQEGQQLRIIINKREQYGGPKRDERLKKPQDQPVAFPTIRKRAAEDG